RDIAAHERVGALPYIDASDVEGDPHACAGDAEQSDRGQRVIEIPALCHGDEPRHDDEDSKEKYSRGSELVRARHIGSTPGLAHESMGTNTQENHQSGEDDQIGDVAIGM